MRSVEDVFGDVLKYLTSTFDGLSASGTNSSFKYSINLHL